MSVDLIVWFAALVVAGLVFTLLIKVMKATIKTAVTIAIIVGLLYLFFGVSPDRLWQQIVNIPQAFWQIVTGK